eukprot:scaffold35046_cov42-Prasinocladus_malaysianus.AAC.1
MSPFICTSFMVRQFLVDGLCPIELVTQVSWQDFILRHACSKRRSAKKRKVPFQTNTYEMKQAESIAAPRGGTNNALRAALCAVRKSNHVITA